MRVRSRFSRPLESLAYASLCLGLAMAQPPPTQRWETVPIVAVRARPKLVSDWELSRLVGFALGEIVRPEDEKRSVDALLATERFSAVQTVREPAKDGDRLVFLLQPQTFVRQIRIRGNHQVSRRKVRSWLPFRYYDRLVPELISRAEEVLGDRYVQAGFDRPTVRVRQTTIDARGASRVEIDIHETPLPELAGPVRIEGRPPGLQLHERIWLAWNNRRDHLWSHPELNKVHLKEHVDRAVSFLKGIGFVEAQGALELEHPEGKATAIVRLTPGKRVQLLPSGGGSGERHEMEAVFWSGGYTLSEGDLARFQRKAAETLENRGWVGANLQLEVSETPRNKVLAIHIDGGVSTTVRTIAFEGNRSLSGGELLGAMLTETKGWLPFLSAPYRPPLLQDDVRAVQALYALHGFPTAQAETDVDVAKTGDVAIRVKITEGAHQKVGRIHFEGETAFSEDELLAIAQKTGLVPGSSLSRAQLSLAAQAIGTTYARRGYPNMKLQVHPLRVWGESTDLGITVAEGQVQQCGKLIAVDNYKTSSKTMLGGFPWHEGAPLDVGRLARLRERQVDLGVFDSVLVEPVDRGDGRFDVLVRANERRSATLDLSALVDSSFGAGVEVGLGHENLFGRGLGASVDASLAANGVKTDSIQLLRVGGSLRKATFLGKILPTTLSGFYTLDRTGPDRESRKTEGSLSVARSLLRRRLQLSIGFSLKQVDETLKPGIPADPNNPLQNNRTFSISPRAVYDVRNDITDPTAGMLASLRLQLAPSILGGQNDFFELDGDVRRYLGLGHGFTLATALRAGIAAPFRSQNEVPSADRFFLGGDSTNRAFSFGQLGPRAGDVFPGGTSFVLANAELRFPLFGALHGGLFADLGNAFAAGDSFTLRPGFGIGLRYSTIIGPLRGDVGWNPDPRTYAAPLEGQPDRVVTESSFVFHVALGHAF